MDEIIVALNAQLKELRAMFADADKIEEKLAIADVICKTASLLCSIKQTN